MACSIWRPCARAQTEHAQTGAIEDLHDGGDIRTCRMAAFLPWRSVTPLYLHEGISARIFRGILQLLGNYLSVPKGLLDSSRSYAKSVVPVQSILSSVSFARLYHSGRGVHEREIRLSLWVAVPALGARVGESYRTDPSGSCRERAGSSRSDPTASPSQTGTAEPAAYGCVRRSEEESRASACGRPVP